MPTASRLFAAIILGVLGWIVSDMIRPLMIEGLYFGWFNQINAGLGLAIGWIVVGSRAGRGMGPAIGNGATGVIVLLFWGLFVFSGIEMIKHAMRKQYDGAFEAFTDTFSIMAEYFFTIATPEIISSLIIGGMLSGIVSEWIGRRWS